MRWRVQIAIIAAGLVAQAARPASADWKVRRSSAGTAAGHEQARVRDSNAHVRARRLLRGLTVEQRAAAIEQLRQRVAAQPDVGSYVALAEALLADGRATEAADRFSDAISLDPLAGIARLGRARAFQRAGQMRQALADYRAALSTARERSDRMALASELIDAATVAGDTEAEIDGRRAWAELRPGPAATADLAAALARGNRFREAATLVASVVARDSAQESARRALDEGRYWTAADELERAADALERARRVAPAAATSLRRDIFASLVDVSRRRGTLDELARALARPRDVVEWEARAAIAGEQGDSRGVWMSLDEAIRLRPADIDLHRRRLDAARRVTGGVELARLYELFADIAMRNRDAAAFGEALDELWRLGRQDRAARIFDRVLAAPAARVQLIRVAAELAGKWGDDRRAERGWQIVLRHHPRDEAVIVSLGEIRLQRGDRRGAMDVWRTLLRSAAGPAEAHARLAETLADHEFADAAVDEAKVAIALAPRQGRPRRVLAGILERQGKRLEAQEAWGDALRLAGSSSSAAAERREARIHLVNLWIREGAGRVAAKVAELEEHLRGQAHDEEVRLCLLELFLRTDRIDQAMALLKDSWDSPAPSGNRDSASPAASSANVEGSVDLVFMLIRSLRQRHRTAEAMRWLEAVSTRFPARAREARLQLADMALAAHDDQRAAAFASAAVDADPDDPVVALRAAAIDERLGNLTEATRQYRRVLETNVDAAGLVALAGLMSRTGGEPTDQRALLRQALRRGADEDLVTEAGRRALALEEALGSLDDLSRELSDATDLNASHAGRAARRRVLALVLTRLVPSAYRSRDRDPGAAARLSRYGRDGIRPLLDLVREPEGEAAIAAIEALGMLGRSEAAPELTRLLIADDVTTETALKEGGATAAAGTLQLRTRNSDVARAIVVALGRIGGDAARTTLEAVARVPQPGLAAALLWSLGRVASPVGAELAVRELGHSSTDTSLIACLTLGRMGGRDAAATLQEIAADPSRPSRLRAAAILGMVMGHLPVATAQLAPIAAGEAGMVSDMARAGLDALQATGTRGLVTSDEGPLILGSLIDPPALVRDMTESLVQRRGAGGEQPP